MSNETANPPNGNADDGFIAFSNDNPSSNWRKTPFKSSYNSPHHQNRHDQFSPFHGSSQGFSSPIHHQRNHNGNRRQSGNSYGDRFKGNQSYGRGNNWRSRKDNRKFKGISEMAGRKRVTFGQLVSVGLVPKEGTIKKGNVQILKLDKTEEMELNNDDFSSLIPVINNADFEMDPKSEFDMATIKPVARRWITLDRCAYPI